MQFLRCSCELWLVKQRPDLVSSTDPALQRIFDEGNVVDGWAQKLFSGAVNVDGFGQRGALITKQAIADGATVLLQPTFMTDSISCRCDILVKNGDAWDIYEVKASTSVKEEYLMDVAFQRICLEEAGVKISRTFLVHLNNQYIRNGEIEVEKMFATVDITSEVENVTPLAKKEIPRALAVLDWDKVPGIINLSSCNDPEECKFLACYLLELEGAGVYTITPPLPSEQQIIINKEAIKSEFADLQYPLYFLDYETFFPAVPLFDGYRPYQQMVFQYSVHVLREPGADLEHFEYLADKLVGPAVGVAQSLQGHIGKTGSVIVWNMRFEASRNAEIGRLLPEFADLMANINDRMYDLMMIVRNKYYVDSRFGGSASLKKVLPVLCPELSYNDLAIHEGGTASASWVTLTDPNISPEIKNQLKKDMLAYCGLDTYAMVAIYRKLLEAIK